MSTARLCDKCTSRARFIVESLDLAFCAHHWQEVEPKIMAVNGRSVIDYRDQPIPDYQPA
jgi:hypothetical protein